MKGTPFATAIRGLFLHVNQLNMNAITLILKVLYSLRCTELMEIGVRSGTIRNRPSRFLLSLHSLHEELTI